MKRDTSTINRAAFDRLPLHKCPPTYHVSRHEGAGCFMYPPGHPSYFVRSVYTQYGSSPRIGSASEVMTVDGVTRVLDGLRGKDGLINLLRLYAPLPFDHPRTQAWISVVFGYFKGCGAVERVRRWYPEWTPTNEEIKAREAVPGYGIGMGVGDWWERHDARPSIEECEASGEDSRAPTHGGKYTACQFCGWRQE